MGVNLRVRAQPNCDGD